MYLKLHTSIQPQTVYETTDSKIYDFLLSFDNKQIIEMPNSIQPLSKKYILNKLTELKNKKLNSLERDELNWYIDKYALEANNLQSKFGEFNLIEKEFKSRIFPIVGYDVSSIQNYSGLVRRVGVRAEASYGEVFGFMFEYLDYGEYWENTDKGKDYSPARGHFFKPVDGGIEYSDLRGQLNISWNWGVFSIKKDYNKWGYGKFGQLFISSKAASYPHIELRLHPTEWLSFNYMHGWLNSLVPDSANFFFTNASNIEPVLRKQFRSKYIAANYISVRPLNWLNFSAAYSFVYSGDLRAETFIPFIYYNQNTGREAWDDGNGMLAFEAAVKYPKKFMFYGTLLMDDIEIRDILKGTWWTSWIAYTVGMRTVDLFFDNFDVSLEYTKTDPWLYEHRYDVTTYKHLDFTLGHWIGRNADLLNVEFEYSLVRGLNFNLSVQYFRKGGEEDIYYAYEERTNLPFLYSPKLKDFSISLNFNYEVIHNFYLSGNYIYSNITEENPIRTQHFLIGKKNRFEISVSYGLNKF